jgi:hypothetical protein
MGGMITSATSEETIFPKAAPMITPTARSTTLPRLTNDPNSLKKPIRNASERKMGAVDDAPVRIAGSF